MTSVPVSAAPTVDDDARDDDARDDDVDDDDVDIRDIVCHVTAVAFETSTSC